MDNWACVEATLYCCEAAGAHAQSLVGWWCGDGVARLAAEMEAAKIFLEVVSESLTVKSLSPSRIISTLNK